MSLFVHLKKNFFFGINVWKECCNTALDNASPTSYAVRETTSTIDLHEVCCGDADSNFVKLMKASKGIFLRGKKIVAFEDSYGRLTTIHTSGCLLVISQGVGQCSVCTKYRLTLNKMLQRLT